MHASLFLEKSYAFSRFYTTNHSRRKAMSPRLRLWVIFLFVAYGGGCKERVSVPSGGPIGDWPAYGRDAGGSRYSPLTQITRENVNHLQIAWIYHTGDIPTKEQAASFEATPILIGGITQSFCVPQ
jgi:hypothetical protein